MASRQTGKKRSVDAGDVFAFALPDGRFGAVRVIRREAKAFVLATTPYLGQAVPSLDEPLLSQILILASPFAPGLPALRCKPGEPSEVSLFQGQPTVAWVSGNPPNEYIFVGNIPVSEVEAGLECNTYWGTWKSGIGYDAYYLWRRTHDREAFMAELEQQEAALLKRLRTPTPKPRMSDDEFWGIISLFDWSHAGDDAAVTHPAVVALAKMAARDIKRFEEALAYKLYQLDTRAHERAAAGGGPGSSDGFLYARCAAVAGGKAVHEAALHDPAQMPVGGDFEGLLTVASDGYTLRTGKDFDYSAGYNYETGFNDEGWQTEESTAVEQTDSGAGS